MTTDRMKVARHLYAASRNGGGVHVDSEDAKQIALWLMGNDGATAPVAPRQTTIGQPGSAWSIDLYAEGSCVYRMKHDDSGVEEIAAWAKNAAVAKAALGELQRQYPNDHFIQRRRAHVEGDTHPNR